MKTYRYTKKQWDGLSPHEPLIPESELEEISKDEFQKILNDAKKGVFKKFSVTIHEPYGWHKEKWRTVYAE